MYAGRQDFSITWAVCYTHVTWKLTLLLPGSSAEAGKMCKIIISEVQKYDVNQKMLVGLLPVKDIEGGVIKYCKRSNTS